LFEILINRHLLENETKFREFFRINHEQFNFILPLVEYELTTQPSNKSENPYLIIKLLSLSKFILKPSKN